MSTNAKANRELGRTPKHSTLFSNVTAIVFAPVSGLQTETLSSDHGTGLRSSPTELFEAFKDTNYSSMRTRLNESLEEMRLAGWIAPCTLLIKAPLEELEVIKEAWRRRFLRSPEGLLIRDIGVVASVEMENIQQSPFLPLARALYEAIAALNEKDQPATQESIVDFLFEAYQYVHMPKLNVIHGCLGILIKEGKIYHNGSAYFVSSSPAGPPSGDKPSESATPNEVSLKNNDTASAGSNSLIRCTSCQLVLQGDVLSQKGRPAEVVNRCTECGRRVGKADGQVEESLDTQETAVAASTRKSRRIIFGKGTPSSKRNHSCKDTDPREAASKIQGSTDTEKKGGSTKEKRRPRSNSHSNSVTSETSASSASGQVQRKNDKADKLNQEGKKSKRNVFSQMSCFISKTFSTADVCNEQGNASVKLEETLALGSGTPMTKDDDVDATQSCSSGRAYKEKCEAKTVEGEDLKRLRDSVVRSRSFVAPAKKRGPENPNRSMALTTNGVMGATEPAGVARLKERRADGEPADFSRRNVVFRRSMPPLTNSGTFPVGIVRPLTNSHTTADRRVAVASWANAPKAADSSRKSSGSGTPSSTPMMKEKASGHARKSAHLLEIPNKGTEGYTSFRTMEKQMCTEAPFTQLHYANTRHSNPSSSKFRESAPLSKAKYFAGTSHSSSGMYSKKTTRTSVPSGETHHTPVGTTRLQDHSCKPSARNVENWTNHGSKRTSAHEQMGGLLDSQDICLEAVSSSEGSERPYRAAAGGRFAEVEPLASRQFVDGELSYDDGLTFIGII